MPIRTSTSAFAGIAEATHGLMAKQVIVTVGELKGKDIDTYVNLTSKGGTSVLTAIGSMLDTNVSLNLAMLTLMQKNMQGTIFGGGNPHFDIPQLLSMYKAGKLNLDDMITRQYKLEQINEGYTGHAGGPQHPRRHPLHRRRQVDAMSQETVEKTPASGRIGGLVAVRAGRRPRGLAGADGRRRRHRGSDRRVRHQPRRHRSARQGGASAAFFDANIGPNQLTVTCEETFPSSSPNEIAYILVLRTKFPNGFAAPVRGVFTYRVNDAGLITNLRGYWNMDAMEFSEPDKKDSDPLAGRGAVVVGGSRGIGLAVAELLADAGRRRRGQRPRR